MTSLSIRARLTLWYAGSVLLLLLTTTALARALVRDSLAQEFARSQETAATLVRGFFSAELTEYRETRITVEHIVGELVIPDKHIHFIQPDGSDYVPPDYVRVMPLPALAPPEHRTVWPLDTELAPGWSVRLTASRARLISQQQQLDRWALLAIPFALGLAGFAGWMLTGRTLRPITEMADAADRISAADATGRIPVAVPGDELGRLGSRFNALLDRLDGALAHQRRFLADAAHELRTPIARARGAGELALSHPADSDDDRAALAQTQQELEAMSRLVDELFELARSDISRGTTPLVRGFLDDVVADAVHSFRALAAQRHITLALEVPHEAPAMMDAASLTRLVGILVHNALKYSNPNTTVRVRVDTTSHGAVLEVEDSGIGIDESERDQVFDRFYRGASARKMSPDGSGLGLAIARAIAERHGAQITLAAADPQGTRVTVTFPPV